jgi:hypothetical protein
MKADTNCWLIDSHTHTHTHVHIPRTHTRKHTQNITWFMEIRGVLRKTVCLRVNNNKKLSFWNPILELRSINYFENEYDNVNQEIIREIVVSFTHSNYKFALTEKYEILVMKFGKISGSYLQPKQCTQKRNIEALSCNHCCSEKATRMTYSECVFMALGFHHAMGMGHIITCSLSGSTIFFYIIS